MTTTANIGNTYDIQKVILSPISDDQSGILDNNLEPPYVRIRARNASSCFIDNFDRSSRITNTSYSIGDGSILMKRTKRFAINYYVGFVPTPNINERNNTLVFSTGAGTFTATIPAGFYTRTQAIAALLTALNALSGTSLVTFTAPNQFANLDAYITITGTGAFRFESGTFVTTGFAFWGFLPRDPRLSTSATLATTLIIGPITALYTRYYDICSTTLLEHTKAGNTSNRAQGSLLCRIYASADSAGDPAVQLVQEFDNSADATSWNFDAGHSLSLADIQLYDEFRQPLYLPNGFDNASTIQMAFANEL